LNIECVALDERIIERDDHGDARTGW